MVTIKRKFGKSLITASIITTNIFLFSGISAKADTVVKNGKISYYNPIKPGSDEKTMTENDCAVDKGLKWLPKGTFITVKNLDNGKSKVLEKWDHGDFASIGVVVDVLPNTFISLGGVKSKGWISNGRMEYLDPIGLSNVGK